jgi:hypothetical protein
MQRFSASQVRDIKINEVRNVNFDEESNEENSTSSSESD